MERSGHAWLLAAALLIVIGTVSAACSGDGQDGAGSTLEVTFDGSDCAYNGPEEVSESDIGFRVVNESDAILMLEVVRLQEGRTFDDLVTHVSGADGSEEAPPWAPSVASVPAPAGEASTFGMALSAGAYAIVCKIELPGLWAQAVATFTVTV